MNLPAKTDLLAAATTPEKVGVEGLEQKWGLVWENDGVYRFRRDVERSQVYSIDTPPPTASGSLHVGHVFSYTHTDVVARFKRMSGFEVFYPMGWDDNGLPTERRVQNYYGVRCDPNLPYVAGFTPPFEGGDNKSSKAADQIAISRRNFIELCEKLTVEDEKVFEALWRQLGLSVDWKQTYQTIAPSSQAVSQKAFLNNLARGEAYQSMAPTLWDITFRTAVAQAELEDRDQPGAYHRVGFDVDASLWDGGKLFVETTRPEMLPACVALVAHPDDDRYKHMFGKPKPITHPVKFFEKGDKPLEIVSTRQWYVRNGGRDADLRERLIALGKELNFHPDFMRVRYENWVNGLTGDWLISRQRFFGVPIPVWYSIDANGETQFETPLVPDHALLPVDPSSDVPAGYTESQRNQPNGFVGELDIMDTWATSSLTPQLAGQWLADPELFAKVFPFDLRPQGQDIIRTWLFSTVLRSEQEHGKLPWSNAALSGWILDPDRKKMSKSKGNVVTPSDMLEEHGSDAVRYWAASARLGTDAAFDTGQMKIGRRLAIKLLNAAKFALSFEVPAGHTEVTEAIDQAMLLSLADVVRDATRAFENYDHTKSLELTEKFFWNFTDDYLELVKERAYGQADASAEAQASAAIALRQALHTMLRLLAPFLPFATEEIWSWWQSEAGSIHRASWPTVEEVTTGLDASNHGLLELASTALVGIRKAKSDAKASMKADVLSATMQAPAAVLTSIRVFERDLKGVGRISDLAYAEADEVAVVDVVLKPAEEA